MTETKYVYDLSEGDMSMKPLLGGKGAGLADMAKIGVPVPDAFTVTTQACVDAMNNDGAWPAGLADQVQAGLARLEERTGRKLGATERPLLVSVRSGAVQSMPGMMDTILNLGISDTSVEGVIADVAKINMDYIQGLIADYQRQATRVAEEAGKSMTAMWSQWQNKG